MVQATVDNTTVEVTVNRNETVTVPSGEIWLIKSWGYYGGNSSARFQLKIGSGGYTTLASGNNRDAASGQDLILFPGDGFSMNDYPYEAYIRGYVIK